MKKELGIFVLLVGLCAVTAALQDRFLTALNMQNLARLIGMFGIFSIGVAFTIITAGIDLSVGSLFALQGVVLSMLLVDFHWPWPLAVLATILGATLLGLFHGFLIAKVRMQAFIVTLCGLLSYRGLARFVTADNSRGFSGDSAFMERVAPLKQMATGLVHLPGNFAVPIPFLVFIVVAVVMWVVLHRSVYGRYLFAVGRNEEAARYSGIPTRWVIGSAYVVSGALAGVSGVMLAFYSNSVSPATHGSFYELYGIAAAVLGGCSLMGGEGSIVGVVIGTALLQVLRNIVNMLNIPSSLEFTLMGVVILLGVLADQIITQRRKRRLAG